jgi:4-hydroxybenzoate polyprenyltransferase
MSNLSKLLRINQYYKNLVIYLPLIFSGNVFDTSLFLLTTIGFVALSLISSTNYIINDIVDAKKDAKNKEKKSRPIASGAISSRKALLIAFTLLLIGSTTGLLISKQFFIFQAALILSGMLYTFFFRNEPFLDVIIIAVNFVLRAISGAVLIQVMVSPWLILCPFFLALFLAVGKRRAENKMLGKKATEHRKTLSIYTPELTSSLMNISTTLLIISYGLYSFLSVQGNFLLATFPAMLYVVFRYRMLEGSDPEIARHPELLIKDKRSMVAMLVWAASVLGIIYFF